jgi:hypothetical protein
MDAFISSSEAATEEEVTHSIGLDRVKMVAWKRKGKKDSSSKNGSSSLMGGIMSTLRKVDTSFTKTQMWKQYNKLRETNTANMDVEELARHRETLRLIKKDLNFTTQNAEKVQDKDDE